MNSIRRVAHIDMDAFFASVELLDYPELKGMPVVVGGRSAPAPERLDDGSRRFTRLRDYVGRGVATTSTYPARALGVHSGMGLMKAARLAPDAVLLPANFAAYREVSQRFKAAVATIAPQIEDRGIDEIYADLSELDDDSPTLARRIRAAVFAATGLTCSVGIAPNKLLAKICSDLDKPDGMTVLTAGEIEARIWPLPAKRINGVGPKTAARLADLGIATIGDLAAATPARLVEHFGEATGNWLHEAAHGRDERPVVCHSEPKSVSRETTFARDLHARADRAELTAILDGLCERVAADLERSGYGAQTIGIKLRYADFRTRTRDITLSEAIAEARAIRAAAASCLKRVDLTPRLRLLGVRASGLCRPGAVGGERLEAPAQGELPF